MDPPSGHDVTGSALFNEVILEKIFSFLPLIDLLGKERVCRFWKNAARRVAKLRAKNTRMDYKHFQVGPISNSSSSVKTEKRRKISSNSVSICNSLSKELLRWRNQWNDVPRLVILSCKSNKVNTKDFSKTANKIYKLFQKYLPNNCVLTLIKGPMCNCQHTVEFCLKIDALIFPSTTQNHISVMAWKSLSSKESESLTTAVKNFALSKRDLKMLIIFIDIPHGCVYNWFIERFCPSLQQTLNTDNNVTVLGCLLNNNVQYSSNCNNQVLSLIDDNLTGISAENVSTESFSNGKFFALALNGDSVHSVSALVESNVDTIAELRRKLGYLKEAVDNSNPPRRRNQFGIMVSCVDRLCDTSWYANENLTKTSDMHIERIEFENAFPSLSMISMHGYGEVGNKFIGGSYTILQTHSRAAIFSVVSL